MATTKFSKVQWGDGLTVTPDPDDPAVIRVDGTGGATGATGPAGPTGATGATGAAGPGVPTGGSTGQVLTKTSGTDYATNWQTPSSGGGAPSGAAGGALDGSYPNPGLAASVAGAGLSEASDVLSVNVDGTTLGISSDTLRVTPAGIHLDDLGDVTAPSPADEQVLAWDAGGSNWQPKTALLHRVFGSGWTGLTPSLTVASAVWKVPLVAGASVTFTLGRMLFRLETPGSATSTVRVEKSTGGSAFSPSTVGTLSLTSGSYESSTTSGLGSVSSGDLLRIVFAAVGAAAAGYLITLEGAA